MKTLLVLSTLWIVISMYKVYTKYKSDILNDPDESFNPFNSGFIYGMGVFVGIGLISTFTITELIYLIVTYLP